MCIAKCLYKADLSENLGTITAQECKHGTMHFRLNYKTTVDQALY